MRKGFDLHYPSEPPPSGTNSRHMHTKQILEEAIKAQNEMM